MRKVKIGEITDSCLGKMLDSEKNKGEYSPYLANINVRWGSFDVENLSEMRFEAEEQERYGLIDGDLVMCEGGEPGRCAIWHNQIPNMKIQKALHRIRPHEDVDIRWLYYWFLLYGRRHLLDKFFTETTIKHLPGEKLKEIELELPDKEIQTEIADVLTAIDEKIEHNLSICAELESMAKTLYDYWFVQFDFPDENGKPYRTSGGKMIGNDRTKREIPNRWKDGNLYDIADFVNGLACQKYRPDIGEEGLPVIKIKEMHDGISEDTEFVSMNIPRKYVVEDGDLLFSWSATLETMFWYGGKGGLNQHIFKVVPKASYPIEYVYEQLSAYIINFVKMAEARKTTMGHITTDHLNQSKIVLPSPDVLEKYAIKVKPIYQRIGQLKRENIVLSKLRDWLLPMLMNGQATVVDEEKKKSSISETAAIPATDPRFTKWLKTMGLAARGTVNRQTLLDIFNAIDEDDKQ